MGAIQIAVTMDLLSWANRRHTPLWLELAVEPGEAFRALEAEQPPRLLRGPYGRPYIPLFLPLGIERQAVVDDVYRQIEDVLDLAKGCRPTVALESAAAEQAADDDGAPRSV